MSNTTNSVLTQKDIANAYHRWLLCSQICFNYETMQSCGVVYSLGPCLEKLYQDDPETLKEKFKAHFQFFNTQPWMGNVILGAALAVEETKQENCSETANAIKTSLMGPFAGLGDSIFFVLPKTILGAIAAYMAIDGSPVGVLICLAVGLAMLLVRRKMWDIGYKEGVRFVTQNQAVLNNLTDAASVLGLMVVGALIASMVKANIPLTFTVGEATKSLQDTLNSIMPNLVPLLVTSGTYWALGKKKMTSTKMVWLIIIFSIIAYALGILA